MITTKQQPIINTQKMKRKEYKHTTKESQTTKEVSKKETTKTARIYPEKTIIQKESCTKMFIAALFTIARTWKQPKCP